MHNESHEHFHVLTTQIDGIESELLKKEKKNAQHQYTHEKSEEKNPNALVNSWLQKPAPNLRCNNDVNLKCVFCFILLLLSSILAIDT